MAEDEKNGIELTERQRKARRSRSIAIGVVLAALVIIFYLVTVVKIGPEIFNRPI